jgi:hypothetical protein
MKAEIISIVKDEDDVLLQVRCSPPSRVFESDSLLDTEILEKMGKTLLAYLEEEDERVEKRDKEIAEYKRQQSRFRLGYMEIENKEE